MHLAEGEYQRQHPLCRTCHSAKDCFSTFYDQSVQDTSSKLGGRHLLLDQQCMVPCCTKRRSEEPGQMEIRRPVEPVISTLNIDLLRLEMHDIIEILFSAPTPSNISSMGGFAAAAWACDVISASARQPTPIDPHGLRCLMELDL